MEVLLTGSSMDQTIFQSILFERTEDRIGEEPLEAPSFFVDLNLDQVVDAITVGKQEYNLKPFFYAPLHDADAIEYRHGVMRDLESGTLLESIESFAQAMHEMREHLAQADRLHHKHQRERWFLDAVEIYCDAVNGLAHDLSLVDLKSRGFLAFREYLSDYANSERFGSLLAWTKELMADLSTVRYCLHTKGNSITVRKYQSEVDYGAEIEDTFGRFKHGVVKDYRSKFPDSPDMNHVEAKVLDCVAQLYPDRFLNLDEYCRKNRNYLDVTIDDFDREIQFYIAYLGYVARLLRAGLEFCYPQVSSQSREVYNYEGFDVALAQKLVSEDSVVVPNDFHLKGKERIIVVSGPNQGGKTTFARAFGQLHYLASLGCPVPGREAQIFPFDRLFTHFEKEEIIHDLRGALEDDLVRIHHILDQATSNSIIIMNEIFASTTLQDAIFLNKEVMKRIHDLDLLCVWVTFVEQLASFSEKTVSMVSTVDPENPALRTFRIVRKPADGLAYAISIVERYRLTYDHLRERVTA